jgi:hypothetical protein
MTTQNSVFAGLPGGLTLTKKLFTLAAPDTVAYTSDSTVNRTNATDEYVFTFGEAVAISGNFTAKVFLGATVVGSGKRTFAGTDGETATATPEAAVLDSATLAKIDSILEDTGTTLPAAIAAIDAGGSGTGARTVTITVNDGTTALQNATVRMTEGANTFTALTNVSGVAVFNLDDATYTVGVTKSGYSYAGTTLIVNGTETATYSMTQVSVTSPTQPDGCVIQVLCLNGVTPQQGVAIQYRAASIPSGDLNRAFLGTTQTATSNSSGIASFEVAQGSGFEWKRGDVVEWSSETAAVAASMDVRSVIGAVR